MDLETVIQNEVSQKEKKIPYNIAYMWNLKNGTNEFIYKADIETPCREQTCRYQGGEWGGMNWEIGIDIYTLLCVKQITNKNLLYSTGNSTQFSVPNEKEIKKMWGDIHVYIELIHFSVQQKVTQHCKAPTLQ